MNSTRLEDATLIIVFCIVAVLIVCWPILRFLRRPWIFRRGHIFGALEGDAAVYYYQQFRPGAMILRQSPPVQAHDSGREFTAETQKAYHDAFKKEFSVWYGKRYFIVPIALLIILNITAAFWAQRVLFSWANSPGPGSTLRALSAAALAGAFVWVISDEIDRLQRRDFTTSDVFYYVFRILLAIPFAWAIAAVTVDGKVLGLAASIPLAFFLGCFPTNTLFKIARRFTAQTLKLGDDQGTGTLELESLQSVTKTTLRNFKMRGL